MNSTPPGPAKQTESITFDESPRSPQWQHFASHSVYSSSFGESSFVGFSQPVNAFEP